MQDDNEIIFNEIEELMDAEGDPSEEQFIEQKEVAEHLERILSEPSDSPGQTNFMEQWQFIEKVLDSKHLDFNEDNLKEFSDQYGEEFINLLSKRNLNPEERKLFNLTLKARLTNLIQTVIFEKTVREITSKNRDYFDKLNEKLYLENESAVNNLLYDLQDSLDNHGKVVKNIIREDTLEIQQKKEELVEAVKSAEQLRINIAEEKERILKGVAKLLNSKLSKMLQEGIEKLIDDEATRRKTLNHKHFKHLFIVFGISLFVFGVCLYEILK